MKLLKNAVKSLASLTPYEIRKRPHGPGKAPLPDPTLNPIEMILAHYLASARTPTFVQIGACDGAHKDPTYNFTRTGRLRAWLVEPIPSTFVELNRTYEGVANVTLIQAGIADTDGELVMYRVKPEGRWAGNIGSAQLASMSRDHVLKHGVTPDEIEEVIVPALTLSSLISKQGIGAIDILQIDVEGFDARVVEMALALSPVPQCINFEHIHFTHEQTARIYPLLTANGYRFVHDNWNTLAVHRSLDGTWA